MRLFSNDSLSEDERNLKGTNWFSKLKRFSSYFWEKLKDMLLKVIYSLYSSIEDKLLKKYLLEITFYTPLSNNLTQKQKDNYKGDFKCFLPIILKARNGHEALVIRNRISDDLRKQDMLVDDIILSDEFVRPDRVKMEIEKAKLWLKGQNLGTLNINTGTVKPLRGDELAPNQIEHGRQDVNYSFREDEFRFRISTINKEATFRYPDLNVVILKDSEEE